MAVEVGGGGGGWFSYLSAKSINLGALATSIQTCLVGCGLGQQNSGAETTECVHHGTGKHGQVFPVQRRAQTYWLLTR